MGERLEKVSPNKHKKRCPTTLVINHIKVKNAVSHIIPIG
jgi:hypothetical protein